MTDYDEETGFTDISSRDPSPAALAARAAHEANRSYCDSIGDKSQVPWDNAPQWQRDSIIAGAQMIIDNPSTSPRESHAGWLAQKEADGWTYGVVKDVEAKRHPCMVDYDKLPEAQRWKDKIFGSVVRLVLRSPRVR